MIVGRTAERSRLHRLVAEARSGRSGSVLVRGEAGIGKTALLDHAAAIAEGMRVLRVVGIESEAEIPFAALQLMFARDTHRLDVLPAAQARALRGAFGSTPGDGDRLLIGAATLTLLAELAGDGALLCLLDDVQWFDRSSIDALLFAVRRLHADPIATVLAARDGDRPFVAPGIDEILLPRLDRDDAAQLLADVRALPSDLAERVLAESSGNPLAIVELARSATDSGPAPLPAAGRLEERFRAEIRTLPERTRLALLLAAADQRPELRSFTPAAKQLGLDGADLEPAERRRLVHVTADAVEFRHPLIRAAAYQDAPFARRLAVHRALADALSDPGDADRRAWHVAAAASGYSAEAATELERAAERATARGAPAAAARALARAAQLTGDPGDRARRLVGAARAAYDAGQLDRAAELAAAGAALTEHPVEAADAAWVRAQVAYERVSPAAAAALALAAAEPIAAVEPARAVSMLIEASWCARDAADVGLLGRCADLLGAVRGGPAEVVAGIGGLTGLLRGDVEAAVPPLRSLLRADAEGAVDGTLEQLLAGFGGLLIGADAGALALIDAHVTALRGQGALGWLPYALELLALAQLVNGLFLDAEVTVAEALTLASDLGQDMQVVVLTAISAWLAAVRGDDTAGQQAELVLRDARHHEIATAQAMWALALVDLMAGAPDAALDRLDGVCAGPAGRDVTIRAVPDHVEAAVRAGAAHRARRHLPRFAEWARCTGSPAATALLLRCDALLAVDAEAPPRFEAALRVEGCSPYDRARTQLAYGEWLRRHRRRTSARAHLAEALGTFERIGAGGWQARVHAELVAIGDPVPEQPGSAAVARRLTPQELQVVRRAAVGRSNREIAAELFLSPRTVGHHLYKAYPKLGVSKRSELAQLPL